MDLAAILKCLDAERRSLVRDGEVVQILPSVTRLGGANGSWHTIIFSSLDSGTGDRVIEEQIRHYQEIGAEFEWKVYAHDEPKHLRDRLAARGFEIGPSEAVMVLDLNAHAPWINEAPNHPVQRIENEAQLALFRSAAEEIFGKDYQRTTDGLARALSMGSTQHRGYIAVDDGVAVSIGRLYTHPQSAFGGLYGGGTHESHRGRGFYRAVVAARARDAAHLNAKYLLVDALPTSRPILERLGFVRLTETWPCMWRPEPASPAPR